MKSKSRDKQLFLLDIITHARWRLLLAVCEGRPDAEIAAKFNISEKATQRRIERLMSALRLEDRADLIKVRDAYQAFNDVIDQEGIPTIGGEPLTPEMWAAWTRIKGEDGARFVMACMEFVCTLPAPTRDLLLERTRERAGKREEQPTLSDVALDSVGADTEAPTEAQNASV